MKVVGSVLLIIGLVVLFCVTIYECVMLVREIVKRIKKRKSDKKTATEDNKNKSEKGK